MKAKQHPKFIAFSTQKGGVGKSTFTALAASILHYRLGYNVAVFDCDFPQYSLTQMRERDLKAVMENETIKRLAHRQFTKINKKAFPVIRCRAEEALGKAGEFIRSSAIPIDVVFFDLPGTVNSSGILQTLSSMHHIFSPITADRVVLESTLSFTNVLQNVVMKKGQTSIKSVHLFWNMVDGREKTQLYKSYEKVISEIGLSLLPVSVADSKRFRKENEVNTRGIFRSTLLPPDRWLMNGCRLELFMRDFLRVVDL